MPSHTSVLPKSYSSYLTLDGNLFQSSRRVYVYTIITIHLIRANVMRELGPSPRNARVSIAPPPGSTSTTYNSNSIAANSSRSSAIWRARRRPPPIRTARARAARRRGDHVTAATSVRARAAMVRRETSSVSGVSLSSFSSLSPSTTSQTHRGRA